MKAAWLAWSSGKDSAWALHTLQWDRGVSVTGLFTTLNGVADRVAMHGVRRSILEAQARAVGLPLLAIDLPHPCSNEQYEQAMARGVESAARAGVTHFAFGDLFLADVRAYRERQLAGSGIAPLFPIWASDADTPSIARHMIHEGTRAVVVCVDTEQLSSEFLGREYDAAFLADLPAGVDPCGERGEFHTLCYDGPAFRYPLAPVAGEVVRRGRFHFIDQELDIARAATRTGASALP